MPRRLMTVLALALVAGGAGADEPMTVEATPSLVPYTAIYSVSRGRLQLGEMHTVLSAAQGGLWTYVSVGRTTGLASLLRSGGIEETSMFTVVADHLVPVRHDYRQAGRNRDRDFTLAFDWDTATVSGEVRGEPVSESLPDGAVDRHAMPVAVLRDLARGASFPRRYVMVDRGRIRELEARIDREERIETGVGMLDTVVVVQQRLDDPDRRYAIWIAEDAAGHYPARIASIDDDGADMVLELTGFTR